MVVQLQGIIVHGLQVLTALHVVVHFRYLLDPAVGQGMTAYDGCKGMEALRG